MRTGITGFSANDLNDLRLTVNHKCFIKSSDN
jgi:hypothetical protein